MLLTLCAHPLGGGYMCAYQPVMVPLRVLGELRFDAAEDCTIDGKVGVECGPLALAHAILIAKRDSGQVRRSRIVTFKTVKFRVIACGR